MVIHTTRCMVHFNTVEKKRRGEEENKMGRGGEEDEEQEQKNKNKNVLV